jgi:hypothetical protein
MNTIIIVIVAIIILLCIFTIVVLYNKYHKESYYNPSQVSHYQIYTGITSTPSSNLYSSLADSATSMSDCQYACDNTNGCDEFMYTPDTSISNRCYVKKIGQNAGMTLAPNWYTGMKM